MKTTTRFSKAGFILLLAVVAIPIAGYTQTVIDVTSSSSTTVDANQITGSPVTVNISGTAVLSGSPGISKTDGGDLFINFTDNAFIATNGDGISITDANVGELTINSSSSISSVVNALMTAIFVDTGISSSFTNNASISGAGGDGIHIIGAVGGNFSNSGRIGASGSPVGDSGIEVDNRISGNFENSGNIFSTFNGILLDSALTSLTGNFTNDASIESSENSAIQIDGAVGGSFTNSGVLRAADTGFPTPRGISIGGAVGAGFTNSGRIGDSMDRVSQGIFMDGTVTGNFVNDTGGDIFIINQGIRGISITGNFTNRATINSSNNDTIVFTGNVGGSFTNSGALLPGTGSGDDGISIFGTVGDGFTNSGTIGSSDQRVGSNGIRIDGSVTGNFFNDLGGDIFTNLARGIFLNEEGNSLTGNFTNHATIDSSGGTAIEIDGAVGGLFTNTGSLLTGTDAGDDGIFIGSTLGNGFFNSGQIGSAAQRAGGMGIQIVDNVTGSFLNDTGGDIFSTEQAIYSQAVTNDFTNNATVSSLNNRAIEIRGRVGGHFTNAGSIIEAGAEGIYIEGGVSSFENIGAITDTIGRGVRIEVGVDGSFENTADVTNTGEDGISIEGDVGGTFFNSGNFSVIGGSGISIEGGAISSFENTGDLSATAGSAIAINLGVGDLFFNSGTISNTGGSGISIDGAIGDLFENIGVITNTQGSGIFIGGGVGGFFTNSAEITDSGGSGISINGAVGGFFDNGGAISNTQGSGIFLAAGVDEFFVNSGEITETGGSGISIDGAVSGTFENGAAISITAGEGIFLGDAVEDFFVNTGEISNTGGSGISIVGAVGGSFDNEGAISVTLGDGIFLGDSVGEFFVNSGAISQIDGNGISIAGIVFDFFENTGSITGTGGGGIAVVGAVGGAFINSGDIVQAGGSGISIEGAVGTLDTDGFTNSGQIGTSVQRVSGRGVEVVGTIVGDFLNDNGGDIFSTFQGVFLQSGVIGDVINHASIDSSGNIGIRIDGPIDGTLTNRGAVTGFERAIETGPHPTTFFNNGIINGDVVLGAPATGANAGIIQNAVTLDSGSVINGRLDVGGDLSTVIRLVGEGDVQLSTAVTEGIDSGLAIDGFFGVLDKQDTGTWAIDSNFAASKVLINEGTLLIAEGTTLITAASDGLTVNNGGRLGGSGTVQIDNALINDGGVLAPGHSPGTITLTGNVTLGTTAILDYELDTPGVGGGVNDLTVVNSDLTLDGVLNVTDLGGLAEGSYTLFQVGGSITDNGLKIGTLPAGFGGTISVTPGAVILEVVSINQPPVAQNDEFLAFEELVFSGNVFANNGAGVDFDPDDDAFEVQTPGVVSVDGIGGSVDLSSNGNFTYTPPAATLGKAIFTYTIEDPFGATDSATVFIDVVAGADLVLEKTSGSFFTQPGGTINYEILVVNAGPSDVVGARVTDTPPPELSNVTWDCMAIDGATCQNANGVDEIDQTVDIPNGAAVMYTLSGTLPKTGNNPITNTASVSNPIVELNPADNSDSDTDAVGLFADGMESEEP